MKGIFVTGTDTGVGKTYASLGLIAGWREMGLRVGVMKPCETGCRPTEEGEGPVDANMLLKASGSDLSIDEICPYQLSDPLAPAEAAELDGVEICFERIASLYRMISDRHDVTLVEGAGGLMVPFAGEKTTADLIKLLGLPLIIVAQAGLGTINHTWLTVEAARSRDLEVLGVIISRSEDPKISPPGPDEVRNPDAIAKLAKVRIIAQLPFNADGIPPVPFPL